MEPEAPTHHRHNQRLVLTIPAELGDELYRSAMRSLRDPKRHAVYLIADALRRERRREPAQ